MSHFPADDGTNKPNRDEPRAETQPGETSDGSGNAQGNDPSRSLSANGPQEPPDGTKRRAKKIEASGTKKGQAGFSVAEEEWIKTIPQPGHYDAQIIRARINPKPDIVYLNIEYRIVDQAGRPYTVTEMTVLDAKPTNGRHSQSAQGKNRVKGIMEANGKPLSFGDIQAVPIELTGCRARIAVGHRDADGLPVPVVQGIVGPAEPEEEP
jgi:hypothetical protein